MEISTAGPSSAMPWTHNFARRPRDRAKEAHDRRKQKMMDTYEACVLEVKGAQQALGQDQNWVDQHLTEAKQELGQAQGALEQFLAEAMALTSNREPSTTPERTPLTQRTPRKTQRILVMERDVNQLLQDVWSRGTLKVNTGPCLMP